MTPGTPSRNDVDPTPGRPLRSASGGRPWWARVGWVRREGAFSRVIVADLPSGWPPEVRAFALWLAEIAWQFGRGAGSSSGGTPGA